ncbi:MAG: hypothetical protein ACRD0L_17295 [Acidimicrobiales bacterium]
MADEARGPRAAMPMWGRLALVLVAFAGVCSVVGLWGEGYLRSGPPQVTATTKTTSAGTQAYLNIQTVGSIGTGPRPTWVSYLMQSPGGPWLHSTVVQVPANATVHVTVYEYDGPTQLRNPHYGQVTGTVGGVEHVQGYVLGPSALGGSGKGHTYKTSTPVSLLNGSGAAHTFSIPALGVNVPLAAVPASVTTLCSVAPCTLKSPHDIVKFAFKTVAAGVYRWQCFIPCGLNFLDGNSGPMQTLGYMMGFVDVA